MTVSAHESKGEDENNENKETDGLVIGADDFQFVQCVLIHWKDDL